MLDFEQYKLIVESSPNMIWRANTSTECDYFNKTWLDFTGKEIDQEQGLGWIDGVHPDDKKRCIQVYLESFKKEMSFEMDYRLKRNDGAYRWINDRGIPFYNEQRAFIGYIGSCMDITEKIEGQILKDMAHNDGLCKIYNRQYSFQLLRDEFNLMHSCKTFMSILMIDIDNFKEINDTYGHGAGDVALTFVASQIKNEIRSFDISGRYGGDEFIVGILNASHGEIYKVAQRIREVINNHEFTFHKDTIFNISVSIRIGSFNGEPSLEDLINKADANLYNAKLEGKNCICC